MLFQREKKELWRYASENCTAAVDGTTTSQQPQPQRRPHQRPLQLQQQRQLSSVNYCCCGSSSSSSATIMPMQCSPQQQQQAHNSPPPPYSSCGISCSATSINQLDYRLSLQRQPQYATDAETETSTIAMDSEMDCAPRVSSERQQLDVVSSKRGYNCENYGDAMHVDDGENSNSSSSGSSFLMKAKMPKQLRSLRSQTSITPIMSPITAPEATTITTASTTAASTFATTAANMFRNCCGGNFFAMDTSAGSNSNNNNKSNSSSNSSNHNNKHANKRTFQSPHSLRTPEQYFDVLMKKLKRSQMTTLLKAIKSRSDASTNTTSATHATRAASTSTHQTQCILIQRSQILDEEPYVIVWRLFFCWALSDATQLKRLPVCPNERDPVYVCCNPLHWYRVLETETAPPPYQRQMERLKTEDPAADTSSPNGGNSNSASTGYSISSINKMPTGLKVRVPESLSTDDEDPRRRCSWVWCEVAYWELSQRVGNRFSAQESSVNIFADGPCGGVYDGMCLKELVASKTAPTPDDVKYTRQKIGLGLTLSQETDGVWLYNRSTVPIFLYSPTLSESWFRVCRVMPGDCLKAFDNYRAQSFSYPTQLLGTQTGPVNAFSMRISFAKGWGSSYKRQDITRCPCWLEVFFNRR